MKKIKNKYTVHPEDVTHSTPPLHPHYIAVGTYSMPLHMLLWLVTSGILLIFSFKNNVC